MAKISNIFVSVILVADEYCHNPVEKTKELTTLLRKNYANYEVLVIDKFESFTHD